MTLLILGTGNHSLVVQDSHSGKSIRMDSHDPALAGTIEREEITRFIVAIGDNALREKVALAFTARFPELEFVRVVHPSAIIARRVHIGAGAFIAAGVVIQPGATILPGAIVNTRATVDHDCRLSHYCSIAPGAILGGCVTIGTRAAVCIGATVIHGLNVGQDTVIGAGAVVVHDIGREVVAYGTPCRVVRPRKPDERYL